MKSTCLNLNAPRKVVLIPLLLLIALNVSGQTFETHQNPAVSISRQRLQSLTFMNAAYRQEAIKVMVADANQIAKELNLPESLPIVQSNLLEIYISPPRLARASKNIGNITTSNFLYNSYSGRQFSVVQTHSEEEFQKIKAQYSRPISEMDTNAAFQMAEKFLAVALVNVAALNTNCSVTVLPMGNNGKTFVPAYRVFWTAKGQEGHGSVAGVELFEPTKELWQLYVKKPEYILQPPLQITNLDFLLSQTNL